MKAVAVTATIIMTTITTMGAPMAETALYDLMSWMSPAWPIGAFAHSGGLEWAVEHGHVTDRASCTDWIVLLIERGAIHNDMVLFVQAWRAAKAGDSVRLREVAEMAVATQTGFERRLEATAQGAAFRRIACASIEGFPDFLSDIDDEDLAYSVAAAALFAAQGIDLPQALTAWLHGAVSNLVSAAQRLVPLGQTDGQRVLRTMRESIFAAVTAALALPDGDPFDQLGGSTLLADLGCMAHETQYTRLFRT
ncbi:urease accessory protein UreF [Novosphingobium sp. G106]|uniref:urease accessory protein UreF n=1 Tax=Novosphingobium sp. G106 TaxID=2849500 RepID=UPI001C2DDE43|nr:urease accessory protein UreF [Novosphingobium sp. G106]MBV1688500.1 urease accessory protein UreF [Novosphingobium sp. G106]